MVNHTVSLNRVKNDDNNNLKKTFLPDLYPKVYKKKLVLKKNVLLRNYSIFEKIIVPRGEDNSVLMPSVNRGSVPKSKYFAYNAFLFKFVLWKNGTLIIQNKINI